MRYMMLSIAILGLLLTPPSLAADKPLTNDDVIKLVKLGLGDAVVLAKLRQSPTVDFKLDTGDLANLKAAGVSSPVMEAMLLRSASAAPVSDQASPPPNAVGAANVSKAPLPRELSVVYMAYEKITVGNGMQLPRGAEGRSHPWAGRHSEAVAHGFVRCAASPVDC